MRSVLEAGFIFWGLFASFALIVALYLTWMWWTERGGGELRRGPLGDEPGATGVGAEP